MIPTKKCPFHGQQKVYIVCSHLLTNIGGRWARNSEPIATILPPRDGWNGFIMCMEKDHENSGRVHAICEKCCLQQQLLLPEQLGKAWHLTLDGLKGVEPSTGG